MCAVLRSSAATCARPVGLTALCSWTTCLSYVRALWWWRAAGVCAFQSYTFYFGVNLFGEVYDVCLAVGNPTEREVVSVGSKRYDYTTLHNSHICLRMQDQFGDRVYAMFDIFFCPLAKAP